ncbi:MAG: DUF1592 domain-containing protein [Planctomycetales bacterium]|nr:DUF1592 domain-containing protein [Planctomycetales bacterium]
MLIAAGLCGHGLVVADEPLDELAGFLKRHCVRCHQGEEASGGVDLAGPVEFTPERFAHWQDVLHNIQRGDMPPAKAAPPADKDRQAFLEQVRARLDRVLADAGSRDFRALRLTNQQIAWSWKDLLAIDRDYSRDLIEDPVGQHGESMQSTLELSGGYMEVYLQTLQAALREAIPDLQNPPQPYRLRGNDWEQMHYLSRNDLAHGQRRHHKPYRGPEWLGDRFQIPLPPNHFFRIYLHDNRQSGQFRVRLRVRNEPPRQGGERARHEMTVFMDKGFKSPMHAVDNFTVEARPGTQEFEVFGNVADFPGVDPAPVREDEDPYGVETHFKYRFITVQNCSPLRSPSDKPVKNQDWVLHGDGHFVRADDQWIDAWGEEFGRQNWLKRSHAGAQHLTMGKPAVYKQVMEDTSHVVIERIEFDLPWQWPPRSMQPFLQGDQLTDASIAQAVRDFAARAWRRPLTKAETESLDDLIQRTLARSSTQAEALRDLLAAVLADSRFLFLTDLETSARLQNFELVSRLAAFLWRSVPDDELLRLADTDDELSTEQVAKQTQRMLADRRADRLVADFASQWLAFSRLDQVAVNPNYYGWWNPQFKHYMKQESVAFLNVLLRDELSCLNLLASDFVVVNDMMAKFYELPAPDSGHRFGRVPAPPGRGGVLTQAAFLLAHSTGEDAHAVQRGVWLRGRLLGDPPRDPPPAVPALDELDAPESEAWSTKARLAAHRTGVCYDCHKDIDPWGIAMEAYDATGKTRDRILKILPDGKRRLRLPVESQAEIRGAEVAGMSQLQQRLRADFSASFARGFSATMLSTALGRPLTYRDHDAIESVSQSFRQHDHRMSALIAAIVLHPLFRHPHGAGLAPALPVSTPLPEETR